jgi:hypothetical protein
VGESGRGATATGRIDANPADMPHPVRRARGGANRRGLLNLEAQADIGPGAHRPVAEDFGYGIKICEDTTISSTAPSPPASTVTGTLSASSALAGAWTMTRSSNSTGAPPNNRSRMSAHMVDCRGSASFESASLESAPLESAPLESAPLESALSEPAAAGPARNAANNRPAKILTMPPPPRLRHLCRRIDFIVRTDRCASAHNGRKSPSRCPEPTGR